MIAEAALAFAKLNPSSGFSHALALTRGIKNMRPEMREHYERLFGLFWSLGYGQGRTDGLLAAEITVAEKGNST